MPSSVKVSNNVNLFRNLVFISTDKINAVTIHQSSYAKLVSLRNTSAELDGQIRETLLLLTKTRSELIATPATHLPTATNLLTYARRISKYTLPSSYREPETDAIAAEANSNTPKEAQTQTHANGTASTTPIALANGSEPPSQSTAAIDVETTTVATSGTQATDGTGVKTNSKNWAEFLGPRDDLGWTPWPSPDAIRSGALASIQILLDQGVDPATFDPEKSAELEAERKRIMEEEDNKREQEQARMEEERRREMERRMSASGARPERAQEQPKVFQLETLDDDEDDD